MNDDEDDDGDDDGGDDADDEDDDDDKWMNEWMNDTSEIRWWKCIYRFTHGMNARNEWMKWRNE